MAVTQQSMKSMSSDIDEHLLKTVGVAPGEAAPIDLMLATAQVAREQLSRRWVRTQALERADKARRVYYLSMEFYMGRSLTNTMINLGIKGICRKALYDVRMHACCSVSVFPCAPCDITC